MKIAVVFPAPSFSVRDVARGYHRALAVLGHDVVPVDLPKRLGFFERALAGTVPEEAITAEAARLAADAIVAECLRLRPDLVVVVCGIGLHPDLYPLLRRAGLPTATILTECPYQDATQLPIAAVTDYVFVNDRASLMPFRRVNPRTWYLPPAYDPEIHRPIAVGPETRCDVFLVGTGFGERVRFLEAVDWTGIDLRLFGLWDLRADSPLRRFHRAEFLPNDAAARWYSGARVSLNLHRTDRGWATPGDLVTAAYSINPRAYEIAACGGFQLCDDSRPELADVFGCAVPAFHTPEDLGGLVRWALADDAARAELAAAARERVAPHTFTARARTLLAAIEASAPVAA